jgi:hypothetical protein
MEHEFAHALSDDDSTGSQLTQIMSMASDPFN